MARWRLHNTVTPTRSVMVQALIALSVLIGANADAQAGSLRLWREAVVVGEVVHVEDVCDLSSFDDARHREIAAIEVAEAPPAGGRRFIHIDLVRSVLRDAGVNTAELTLGGFVECTVSRPAHVPVEALSSDRDSGKRGTRALGRSGVDGSDPPAAEGAPAGTLRDAVTLFLNQSLARFDGKAVLTFDRASQSSLDLSGPEFSFNIRKTRGADLGLVSLKAQVLRDGEVVQEVPMVVRVRMNRRVLIARRAINLGAVISESDLRMMQMTFDRVDRAGAADLSRVVGQRARSFVPMGAAIRMEDIEPVALVSRGELVDLFARTGAVEIRTSARAMAGGGLGDLIRVRDLNHKRQEFDAVIVGPGRVRIGGRRGGVPQGGLESLRVASGGVR